jgi:hypothetical protein
MKHQEHPVCAACPLQQGCPLLAYRWAYRKTHCVWLELIRQGRVALEEPINYSLIQLELSLPERYSLWQGRLEHFLNEHRQ